MANEKRRAASRRCEKCETGAGAGTGKRGRTHAKKKAFSKKQLVDACRRSNGIMSVVCVMLGVSWHTAEKYIKACPEAAEAFQDAKETTIDLAQQKLIKIINNENHPHHFEGVRFALVTLGKNRGFTEKMENEISGELKQPPVLNILIEKSKDKQPKG